ncbi:Uu.00g134200.m01.CDS01 [Anthostomella pinea]|uniref:Uu.00g134200.m01.CDS01 n=1 Tax=Anthostomella pinea TaxID=933095 RepID=A0AAI8VNV9_9PEZI|nr:Uu.00g134200.m01.CDS01 [Anthostomella pinea]
MQHYKPHENAKFEGYYSKFRLPSGAHLVFIVCTVPSAETRPHNITFTYVPPLNTTTTKVFQRELFVSDLQFINHKESDDAGDMAFEQHWPGGFVKVHNDAASTTEYMIEETEFRFEAKTTGPPTPWMPDMDTPEGILVGLPLPLHWHVHSLASDCSFNIQIHDSDYDLPSSDRSGIATVHQEKNWATSFPSAHHWIQARDADGDRGICVAGGQILGMQAYLLGYHASNPKYTMAFRPPYAVKCAGWSPTMSITSDWDARSVELSIQTWTRKIVVQAQAPVGSFFSLSSPFADGHRINMLAESFRATVRVRVFEAGLLGPWSWRLVHEDGFEGGSLEFGAGYYPFAGREERYC